VKIGEHLLALSTRENKFRETLRYRSGRFQRFFDGEEPGKDLHFFTARSFWVFCSDKLSKKPQNIADRHGKVKHSEHLFL